MEFYGSLLNWNRENTAGTHTHIHSFIQTDTYTNYAHMRYTFLSLSSGEDRGIESLHIRRGTRACGDSGVVRVSRGSLWCAAERNSFESRFLRVTGGGTQHQPFQNVFWFKKWFTIFVFARRSHGATSECWMFMHLKLIRDSNDVSIEKRFSIFSQPKDRLQERESFRQPSHVGPLE